jgi:hypothetical protein
MSLKTNQHLGTLIEDLDTQLISKWREANMAAHLIICGSDTVRVLEVVVSTHNVPRLLEGILRFAGHEETGECRISPLVLIARELEAESVIVTTSSNVCGDGSDMQVSVYQ